MYVNILYILYLIYIHIYVDIYMYIFSIHMRHKIDKNLQLSYFSANVFSEISCCQFKSLKDS